MTSTCPRTMQRKYRIRLGRVRAIRNRARYARSLARSPSSRRNRNRSASGGIFPPACLPIHRGYYSEGVDDVVVGRARASSFACLPACAPPRDDRDHLGSYKRIAAHRSAPQLGACIYVHVERAINANEGRNERTNDSSFPRQSGFLRARRAPTYKLHPTSEESRGRGGSDGSPFRWARAFTSASRALALRRDGNRRII